MQSEVCRLSDSQWDELAEEVQRQSVTVSSGPGPTGPLVGGVGPGLTGRLVEGVGPGPTGPLVGEVGWD